MLSKCRFNIKQFHATLFEDLSIKIFRKPQHSLTNSPSSSLSWFLSSDNSAPELSSTEMKLAGRDAGDVADTLLDVPVPACAVDDTCGTEVIKMRSRPRRSHHQASAG